jgi:RNA polymerase sigma-70 factor (ECF subfamily)
LRICGGSNLINDDELIQRCSRGETSAFDKLYAKYCKPLFNYIYRMTNNYDLAEDILQETILKALTGKTMNPEESFQPGSTEWQQT